MPAEALGTLAERLIDRLDATDDPDADCCADDLPLLPWATGFTSGPGDQDDAEEGADAESSLGWGDQACGTLSPPRNTYRQERLGQGVTDNELECDGRCDQEHSLGWSGSNQGGRLHGGLEGDGGVDDEAETDLGVDDEPRLRRTPAAPPPTVPTFFLGRLSPPPPIKPNRVAVRPEFFPHGHDPEAYAMVLEGRCMEPQLHSGDMAIMSPSAPLKIGGLVALWPADGGQPLVKRPVMCPAGPIGVPQHPSSTAIDLVVVEMLNPPRRLYVPASELRAMHRVVGIYREEELANVRIPAPAAVLS